MRVGDFDEPPTRLDNSKVPVGRQTKALGKHGDTIGPSRTTTDDLNKALHTTQRRDAEDDHTNEGKDQRK